MHTRRTTLAAAALAILGASSDSGITRSHGFPPGGPFVHWVDSIEGVHWADTGANHEYALDALSLPWLSEFTPDRQAVERISSIYWCDTPVLTELASGRLRPEELTETALRRRAQSMIARHEGRL